MKTLRINRSKHLCDEPGTGHNRWHPDVEPLLEVAEGEEVCFETRDALDGYLPPGSTVEDWARFARGVVHPLTGPVYVEGAAVGDVLAVSLHKIEVGEWGWTAVIPGFGFLAEEFAEPDSYYCERLPDGSFTPLAP